MTGPGWEQQQDNEERRFFEEAQELLKLDAEAYDAWIDELIREGLHEAFRAD